MIKCLPFKQEGRTLVLFGYIKWVFIPVTVLVAEVMNLNLYQRKNNHKRELIELFKTTTLDLMIFSGSLLPLLPLLHKHAILEKERGWIRILFACSTL